MSTVTVQDMWGKLLGTGKEESLLCSDRKFNKAGFGNTCYLTWKRENDSGDRNKHPERELRVMKNSSQALKPNEGSSQHLPSCILKLLKYWLLCTFHLGIGVFIAVFLCLLHYCMLPKWGRERQLVTSVLQINESWEIHLRELIQR